MNCITRKFQNGFLFVVLVCLVAFTGCAGKQISPKVDVSVSEVEHAQKQWADMLIEVGKQFSEGGDYKKSAQNLINNLYGYNYEEGVVLFKPTKAKEFPFRSSKEGALSYFIGDNAKFKEDKGFALAPWVNIKFSNDKMYMHGDVAIVMGEYVFTDSKGETAKVEYTFGYVRDGDGVLKIILHHSSLPYQS